MKLLVGEQWNKGSTALFLGGKIGYSHCAIVKSIIYYKNFSID